VSGEGVDGGTMTEHCGMTDLAPAPWAVDLAVGVALTLPSGAAVDRDAFYGWLWDEGGDRGLLGVCEGAVGVDEAAALGLTASPRVLDVAAAPADRDWVGDLPTLLVTCWFSDEPGARATAARLADVQGCSVRGIRREATHDGYDDWKKNFPPIDVPGFGVIRPAWEQGPTAAGGTTVFIEPGTGFGTGLHETTRLCLAALAAWTAEGGAIDRVLDFGSGSGILGIAAAVRGARVVDAVEIDPLVHDAIRGNARRNGVSDRVAVRRELSDDDGRYDLVFANIVAPVLLDRVEQLCGRVGSGAGSGAGCLVLSGLLADELSAVADRYSRVLGAAPIPTVMGEWHCLRFVAACPFHDEQRRPR
jgi:ribosomal protein L11 methyltransferase